MTNKDVSVEIARPEAGLDVQIAHELIQRAHAQGVSLVGEGGLLAGITKTVLQAALDAEMAEHLGYDKGEAPATGVGNYRNGSTSKTVHTEIGSVCIDVPRDRNGEFSPQIVPKHARRVTGFNEAIISLYAKGLTTGEIQAHLAEIYDVDVSRELISKITDKVAEQLAAWQSRHWIAYIPYCLSTAFMSRSVTGKSLTGRYMWVGSGGEGAKHWMGVLSELKNRGVEDVCIVACDGLKGLPESINTIWPLATVQTCVVHLVRASLRYASKDTGARSPNNYARYTPPPLLRQPKRPSTNLLSNGNSDIQH